MPLTQKHHRLIYYVLLAINVIGLILVTIAIILTYSENRMKSEVDTLKEPKKFCTQYSEAKFEEKTDMFGPYTQIKGVVAIIGAHSKKFFCLGALVHESAVLITIKCLRKIRPILHRTVILLYDESSATIFSPMASDLNQRYVESYKESDYFLLSLLFLNEKYHVNSTELIVLPRANDTMQCNEITGNSTMVSFEGKLVQSKVKIMSESDCVKNFPDYRQSFRRFCTESHGK